MPLFGIAEVYGKVLGSDQGKSGPMGLDLRTIGAKPTVSKFSTHVSVIARES